MKNYKHKQVYSGGRAHGKRTAKRSSSSKNNFLDSVWKVAQISAVGYVIAHVAIYLLGIYVENPRASKLVDHSKITDGIFTLEHYGEQTQTECRGERFNRENYSRANDNRNDAFFQLIKNTKMSYLKQQITLHQYNCVAQMTHWYNKAFSVSGRADVCSIMSSKTAKALKDMRDNTLNCFIK